MTWRSSGSASICQEDLGRRVVLVNPRTDDILRGRGLGPLSGALLRCGVWHRERLQGLGSINRLKPPSAVIALKNCLGRSTLSDLCQRLEVGWVRVLYEGNWPNSRQLIKRSLVSCINWCRLEGHGHLRTGCVGIKLGDASHCCWNEASSENCKALSGQGQPLRIEAESTVVVRAITARRDIAPNGTALDQLVEGRHCLIVAAVQWVSRICVEGKLSSHYGFSLK